MTSTWSVLAPIAASQYAAERVEHAAGVAMALGSDLHLLNVVEPNGDTGTQRDGAVRITRQGTTAATILAHADSLDADLLVMNRCVYGSWSRFWRQSVTQQVIRTSRRPICISSHMNLDRDFRFRTWRILCLLDFERSDDALLWEAETIAERSGAELVLLHVVPSSGFELLYETGLNSDRPLSARCALARLDKIGAGRQLPPITVVDTGDLSRCVSRVASEYSVDLVLASRSCSRVYGAGISDLVARLRCPLIAVPTEADALVHSRMRAEAQRLVV